MLCGCCFACRQTFGLILLSSFTIDGTHLVPYTRSGFSSFHKDTHAVLLFDASATLRRALQHATD